MNYFAIAWNKLVAWMKSKNITVHTLGLGIVGFAAAYDSSPDLRNYIGTVFTGYPVVVTRLGELTANIVAGVTLWRNYAHSSSPAGIVAASRDVLDSPNPPTAAQIDAADVKTK